MSNTSPIDSYYRGSKRAAACDRCRAHKAKCHLEGQDGCARCVKAGTICRFSESPRASKGPSSTTQVFTRRQAKRTPREGKVTLRETMTEIRGEKGIGFSRGIPSQDDLAPSFPADGDPTRIAPSLRDDIQQTTGSKLFINHVAHGSRSSGSFAADGLTGMVGVDHLRYGDTQYHMDFGPLENYGGILDQTQSIGTHIANNLPPSVTTPGQNTRRETPLILPLGTRIRETPDWEMDMSGEDRSNVQLDSAFCSAASSLATPRSEKETHAFNPQPRSQEPKPKAVSNALMSYDLQHRRMRELSQLGMTLYMDAIPVDDSNPLDLNLPNCLAIKVLEGSSQFLNLLTSLYSLETSSPSNSVLTSPSDEEMFISDNSDSDSIYTDCTRPIPPAEDIRNRPQPVDMTEIFSLLTCYIRILHLHSFFYSRLTDFLVASFGNGKGVRLPPVFPGLQAGAVSLDPFGKFQVKLFVQICTHVLGKVETALGLPDGYRISKKDRHCQHGGVLHNSISVEFVEMAMRETRGHGTRLMKEEDRFEEIKHRLSSLRLLLKGTINL